MNVSIHPCVNSSTQPIIHPHLKEDCELTTYNALTQSSPRGSQQIHPQPPTATQNVEQRWWNWGGVGGDGVGFGVGGDCGGGHGDSFGGGCGSDGVGSVGVDGVKGGVLVLVVVVFAVVAVVLVVIVLALVLVLGWCSC